MKIEHTPLVAAAILFAAAAIMVATLALRLFGLMGGALEKLGVYGVDVITASAVTAIVSALLASMTIVVLTSAYDTIREEE